MTDNHNYKTPSQGATDWHVPLNDNFENLDTDVEIRDVASNRGQYQPKQGALFRAIDTGNVYIGDGSNWNKRNPPADSTTSSTANSGALIAAPGNVQSVIDAAATTKDFGNGTRHVVRLQSNTVYEPSNTWELKRGVILDCNGARIEPSGDIDVIHQWPETDLIRPQIDVRGLSYSSNVVTLDGTFDGRYAGPNHSRIEAARIYADPGEGVGLRMHSTSNSTNVGDCYISGLFQGFDRAIEMVATASDSAWVNSNHFDVKLMNFATGVYQNAVSGAAVNGNYFDVNTQGHSGTTNWLWDVGNEVAFNYFEADPWDLHFYSNETMVRFQSGAGGMNQFVDRFGHLGSGNIVNSSGRSTNKLVQFH